MAAHRITAACLALASLFLGSTAVQAADHHSGSVLGYYPYYPTYAVDQIPYFAQSPPVYYSDITPRSYGMSPYPYPGSCMCNHAHESEAPRPAILRPTKRNMEPKPAEALQVDTGRVRATVMLTNFGQRRVKTIHFNR